MTTLTATVRAAIIAERNERLQRMWDAARVARIRQLLAWRHPACTHAAAALASDLIDDEQRSAWREAAREAR